MTKMIFSLACGALLATSALAQTPQPPGNATPAAGSQKICKMEKQVTLRMNYLLYLPEDYGKDPNKRWPLVIFLHGAGERGDDINRVKTSPLPKMVEEGKKFPFILISPQCPGDSWRTQLTPLTALLDEAQDKYLVDKSRIYVTGLSMGGFGTWAWAPMVANRLAAIAPICGGGSVNDARILKNLPIWVFHGADDPFVPVSEAQKMVDAIKGVGGNIKLTIYPGVGHDSWDPAYASDEFWKWLLEQHK
jgi:predicted peptidase